MSSLSAAAISPRGRPLGALCAPAIGAVSLLGLVALSLAVVLIAAERPSFLAPVTRPGFFPAWMVGRLRGLWPGLTANTSRRQVDARAVRGGEARRQDPGHRGEGGRARGGDVMTGRRAYGTGSIVERHGVYYGQWRAGGRQVMRRLGPVRQPGSSDGLTKTMAEVELREAIAEHGGAPLSERVSVGAAGERLLAHLQAMVRKPSTMRSYRSNFATQIEPRLGERAIAKVSREHVEQFVADCLRDGLSPAGLWKTRARGEAA